MTGQDGELGRRARLLVIGQDLLTPVRVMLGFQEMIVEEGQRLGLSEVAPYFDNVLASIRALHRIVEDLLAPETAAHPAPDEDLRTGIARLRHDLRTPLNAVIGYSELALEELGEDASSWRMRSDIDRLLVEARRLLRSIDAAVDIGRTGTPVPEPAAGEADAVVARLLSTLAPPSRESRAREVGSILVVDDDGSNRDLLRRRLLHEGHQVVLASNGPEALSLLEREPIDLILLDLLMPGMNGIEVLERLKADRRWHAIPVVMISGLHEIDAVMRCIEAGAEDYLPKPFDLVLLRARINAGLERKRWRERERDFLLRLRAEKDRSEALLRNILPDPIVLRLNEGEAVIADRFDQVAILFADIVGFTPAAAQMTPANVVAVLDRLFSAFDELAVRHGVEKIKTIGDSYMAATGLPTPTSDHVGRMAEFALDMLDAVARHNEMIGTAFEIRVGMHTGPVVAGIIGRHKFIYDVWGDTVNIASRLESQGYPGRIQVSEAIKDALEDRYQFQPRGLLSLRGRGEAVTYLLDRI
jgi:class 3 adenylate cyclase/CheY-like chemotaxis protein